MVYVTFEEIRNTMRSKVVSVVSARLDYADDKTIAEIFESCGKVSEVRLFCQKKYGDSIPFLEVDRIEDMYLIDLIEAVTKELKR